MRALVVIPTYNERENLEPLVRAVLAPPAADVLVVDDASPDGTGDLADALARETGRVSVLTGRASRAWARPTSPASATPSPAATTVVEMDADFSHRPEDLPRLLHAAADGADVVIGSRNVPGGRIVGWSPLRHAISKGGSRYARLLLGLPVRDCTSGFKCFRRRALEALDLDALRSNGYAFQVEVNYACARAGLRLAEVPIVFPDRTRGALQDVRAHRPGGGLAGAAPAPGRWRRPALRRPRRPRVVAPAPQEPTQRSRREPRRRPAGRGLAGPGGAVGLRRRADAVRLGGRRRGTSAAGRRQPSSRPGMRFTVLLPARHEEAVIQETIQRVVDLNYPRELVQVLVVIEAGDARHDRRGRREAGRAARAGHRPRAPDHLRRPADQQAARAECGRCAQATGDVVTIFDAEDEPHPDILNVVNTVMAARGVPRWCSAACS